MIRLVRFATRQRAHPPIFRRVHAKDHSVISMHVQLQPVGTCIHGFPCIHTQVRLLPRRCCSQRHARAFHTVQRSSKHKSSLYVKQDRLRHVQCCGVQTDDKTAQTQTLPQLPALDGEYCPRCSQHPGRDTTQTVLPLCRHLPRKHKVRTVCKLANTWPSHGWQISLC